jgi:uncharacterized protein YndB with AHSA1/START domain
MWFGAPVEQVFRAWSEAERFGAWSWGSLGRNVRAEADFRESGNFRVETDAKNGEVWSFSGIYLRIVPQQHILHTLAWQAPVGYDPVPEEVEITFTPHGSGTRVEFIHTGVPDEKSAEGHREGWQNTMETLAAQLANLPKE